MIYRLHSSLYFLAAIQLCSILSLHASLVLTGDGSALSGNTFSFPIQAHISSPEGSAYYVAAHPSLGDPGEFAISRVYVDSVRFAPLAQQFVTLNNSPEGVADPLYNQHIAYLGLLSALEGRGTNVSRLEHPIAVLSNDFTSVYVIDTFYKRNGGAVESVKGVTDANGAVTSGIVGLGNMSNLYAVAATKAGAGGIFGAVGSGLAIISLTSKTVTTDKTSSTERIFSQKGNLPLDITSDKIKIQNNLASLSNVVCMHWNEKLGVLYVGLQVTTGAAAGDGGLAIAVVGEVSELTFQRPLIAPSTVFTSGQQNEIIGAINPNAQISINNIKSMLTSTNFNYLIVQGNNGAPSATAQSVFALPLVNNSSDQVTHGTVADKTQIPNLTRGGFTAPATTPSQMTLNTDVAAIVGGADAPGAISDMFVRGDTVFVSIFTPTIGELPGLFSSQALFNADGTIKGWTQWARAAGSIAQGTANVDPVYGATFDERGDFTMITGTSVDALGTVKRTAWGTNDGDGLLGGLKDNASVGLVQMMSALFPVDQAGIQGIVDLLPSTPGLSNVSLLAVTGLNKISLVETGTVNSGVITFNYGDFLTNSVLFNNGTITQNLPVNSPTKVVTLTGGALDKLGPITCAEIATDTFNDNAWLVVGGVGGIAVLAQQNGDGWTASTGLGPNFLGLVNGMRFIFLRNYSFVRKLVCNDNFLYVLSDKQLDVIDLNVSNFATGSLLSFPLATLSALGLNENDVFTDFIVSEKFALLACSKGLFRVANGKDIRLAHDPYDAGWTVVPVPESVGPITQLWPITSSGRSQEFALNGGSNIYALNAYVGNNAAQLVRYTVSDVSGEAITSATIEQILNSYPTFGTPIQAPLVFYTGFRDLFATNGALFFNARSKNLNAEPFVNTVVGMERGSILNNQNIYIPPLSITTASHLTQILRNSALGNWIIAGDFGLRVNE